MKNLNDCFELGYLKMMTPNKASADRSIMLSLKKLDAAEIILAQGVFDISLITSYTAMFHAARAVLFRDGVKERSHECIPVYIAGKYPELRSYANLLDSYRTFRHEAIYGLDMVVTKADAETALLEARGFLERMKSLIE
jgi:uncharacterized protein (UPF0332 family)